MRRRLFIIQFPLLLLHSSAPAGADALWDRAIGVATANRDLVPAKLVERRASFDVKGEPHLTSSTPVGFTQSVTGDIHINLLAAESNGTDITEDMRSKFDEQIAHFTLQNPEYNPFHPSHQGQIKAERDGRSRVVGAQVLVRIESHPARLLIDYQCGPSADDLQPRIFVRITPGAVIGASGDSCLLTMTALRTDGMDDVRWKRLTAAHALEVELIKSTLETGFDHRTLPLSEPQPDP